MYSPVTLNGSGGVVEVVENKCVCRSQDHRNMKSVYRWGNRIEILYIHIDSTIFQHALDP